MFQYHTTAIVTNIQLARRIYRVRLAAPEIAMVIRPGQFVMLRIAETLDPLIGRAFALYDTVERDGQPHDIDIVYQVHGKFTARLKDMHPGQQVSVWGPLGNWFEIPAVEHLILVAGGIGQTPFLAVARQALGIKSYGQSLDRGNRPRAVTLCYGARGADDFAGLEEFQATGMNLKLCTEDGSLGHRGLVTQLLEESLQANFASSAVLCCGPERMMQAVSELAARHEVACQVSLETPMACGIGICFTCVAPLLQEDGSWDYKRTCVEGPIFDARTIAWDGAVAVTQLPPPASSDELS